MSKVLRPLSALALAASCALGAGCAALNDLLQQMPKPSVTIADVELTDLTLSSVKLDFGVDVGNPYSVDLPVLNLDYAVSSSLAPGKSLFSGSVAGAGSIPANGHKVLRVPVEVGFTSLMTMLPQVKLGSVVPYAA